MLIISKIAIAIIAGSHYLFLSEFMKNKIFSFLLIVLLFIIAGGLFMTVS